MTLHSECKDFECSKCSALYIPFKKHFKCPKCGKPSTEFFDFISETIGAMKGHRNMYGSYSPPAWFYGSFSDYVLMNIFDVFDSIEYNNPPDPEVFIKEWFAKSECEEEYQPKHVEEIVLLIYQDYKVNKESYIKEEVKERGRFKKWLKNFIP